MLVVAVPYHLDERLPFDLGRPADVLVEAELPDGDQWSRMAVLHERLAAVVAAHDGRVLVLAGDCTTSLGVLAGLQRSGLDPAVVWFDAHPDFHTEASSVSGYLGGMPLALAVGVGTSSLPARLGLRAVPEAAVLLVDGRDTDPGEQELLSRTAVRRASVRGLHARDLPQGPLLLHVDVDVCDPSDVPDLLFPVPAGPSAEEVLDAVATVLATGRVAAMTVAATWRHDRTGQAHRDLAGRLAGLAARADAAAAQSPSHQERKAGGTPPGR